MLASQNLVVMSFPKPKKYLVTTETFILETLKKTCFRLEVLRQLTHLKKFTEQVSEGTSRVEKLRRRLDSHLAGVVILKPTQTNSALLQNTPEV